MANRIQTDRVIARVMLSQLLFMAGNSLTVGGFFNYFVSRFDPTAFLLAAAMIVPETSQSLSVLGRWILQWNPSRKRNWIGFLIVGRVAAMLLPLAYLLQLSSDPIVEPMTFILLCTGVWYLCQGIGYVNYISWLSDLVPEVRWGNLLSRRQMASLLVSLGFPLVASILRDSWLRKVSPEAESWSYAFLFLLGGGLTLTSILPMLSLPDIPVRRIGRRIGGELSFQEEAGSSSSTHQWKFSSSFLKLVAARWWLAFFQGLTQAVLFFYATRTLSISLTTYMVLSSIMVLSQFPMVVIAGRCCDRFGEKWGLIFGIFITGSSMMFWMIATPEQWYWLVPAYVLWGGFGLVNVCGVSLCLKLAPRSDNSAHFAMYDQCSGLIAGMAGLLGGVLLDRMTKGEWGVGEWDVSPYVVLFGISFLGRVTAPLWLLTLSQPKQVDSLRSPLPIEPAGRGGVATFDQDHMMQRAPRD